MTMHSLVRIGHRYSVHQEVCVGCVSEGEGQKLSFYKQRLHLFEALDLVLRLGYNYGTSLDR